MKKLLIILFAHLSLGINAQTITADAADRDVKSGAFANWVGQKDIRVGSSGIALIIPFELPELASGSGVTAASFAAYLSSVANSPTGNVVLSGLSYRSVNTVLVADYDAASTEITSTFATPTSSAGTLTESNQNLIDYINAQYDSGAVAGDFIFFKLQSTEVEVGSNYWVFNSVNNGSNIPSLTLTTGTLTNVAPVLAAIGNQTVRETTTLVVNLAASDANSDNLTFSTTDLPSFATLNDKGDGTATISISPVDGDATTYTFTVNVADSEFTDSEEITLTVTDKDTQDPNKLPVLAVISSQSVEEGSVLTLNLSATDGDNDVLTFSVNNLPSFAVFTDNGNGTAKIVYTPLEASNHAGSYPMIVSVSDTKDTDSETFTLTVSEYQEVAGTAYYCDPVNGSMSNDGSKSNPWKSLKDVILAKKKLVGGDVLFLKSGDHGTGIYFKGSLLGTGSDGNYITIKAVEGESPIVGDIQVDFTSYWAFEGIIFDAPNCNCGTNAATKAVFIAKPSSDHLIIKNCLFRSGAEGSSNWSYNDWYDKSTNAVILQSPYVVFDNNTIRDAMFALQVEAQFIDVTNNLIDNYGADAIRALSSDCNYIGNTVRDAYLENYEGSVGGKPSNHDDALQMYDTNNPASGTIKNVVIRNNKFFQFADPITQAMVDANLVSYLAQGIFQTDGKGINIVIENNIVVTDHYHGITLIGTDNCIIQNNTVVKTTTSYNAKDANALSWIQMKADKQGNECNNSIIRNNLTTRLTPWTYDDGTNITTEGNVVVGVDNYSSYFVDADNYNFQLKEGSPAIGRGVNTDLTEKDIEGNPRISGDLPDAGAYEFQVDTSAPTPTEKDVYASSGDGFVIDPSSTAYTGENIITSGLLTIGSHQGDYQVNNTDLSSIVIPFQLPTIPAGKEISGASLKVYVSKGTEWFTDDNRPDEATHLDLYGLTHRSSSDIIEGDYFTGDFGTGNGSDVGIADNYFTKNVASGNLDTERWEETTTVENTALVNYIKDQYAAGAVAGDYIFLRLSIDNADMVLSQYFKVHSSGDINAPLLKLNFISNGSPEFTSGIIGNQELKEDATPIVLSITATALTDLTYSFSGSDLSFIKFNDLGNGSATITISPKSGDSGEYNNIQVTVTDKNGISASKSFNIKVLKNGALKNDELFANSISVYPNPVINNTFTIDFSDELKGETNIISVYNLSGVVIYNRELTNSKELEIVLPEATASGLYLLNVSNNEFAIQKKIIIK